MILRALVSIENNFSNTKTSVPNFRTNPFLEQKQTQLEFSKTFQESFLSRICAFSYLPGKMKSQKTISVEYYFLSKLSIEMLIKVRLLIRIEHRGESVRHKTCGEGIQVRNAVSFG